MIDSYSPVQGMSDNIHSDVNKYHLFYTKFFE